MGLAVYALWKRDVIRFFRQRSRVVGALGTPLVFWVLLGSGLGRSFRAAGTGLQGGYLEYFFPGTLALIVLFTAIFSTISVIEDRQAGFLQGVLVAPVPRAVIVLGKVLGGTTLAVAQAGLFLMLAPVANLSLGTAQVLMVLAILVLLGFALTGLGFVSAWLLESSQGFHAVMNLLLMPMWLLSGAVFPASGASGWLRFLMFANPMTYGVAALQEATLGHQGAVGLPLSLAMTAGFGLAMLGLGTWLVSASDR
jgi:ABC-2 type transport system permease protein